MKLNQICYWWLMGFYWAEDLNVAYSGLRCSRHMNGSLMSLRLKLSMTNLTNRLLIIFSSFFFCHFKVHMTFSDCLLSYMQSHILNFIVWVHHKTHHITSIFNTADNRTNNESMEISFDRIMHIFFFHSLMNLLFTHHGIYHMINIGRL